MTQARLIKKEEIAERERQVSDNQMPTREITHSAIKTVQEWVSEHKSSERANARQQFAALFS